MEAKVVETLAECLGTNEAVALVTVIANTGSSPGKAGAMMTVTSNSRTCGTVGGGKLEHQATCEAINCLSTGESKEISYTLNPGGELGMGCGGELRMFIRVFLPQPQLIIVGAGHIGLELYYLGCTRVFALWSLMTGPRW
jgi:xanthine dehydrogenase accessory factor